MELNNSDFDSSDLDECVALDNYILGIEQINTMDFKPGKYVMICHEDGNPAIVTINGKNIMFIYNGEKTDEEIFEYMRNLQIAGFRDALSLNGVHGPNVKEMLKYYAGEKNTLLLLDAPIGNIFKIVGISIDEDE